ncbi:MAG: sulfatase [Pseudomonadota bacterium]
MPQRPNILFIIADDASHYSAYGHRFVNTPCFDRVAKEGVLFTHAFTTNPKCGPSRASILTGRHTWQNRESCLHWNYWPDDLPVFPDLLERAGYHVGFTGKPWAPGDWRRCGRRRNPVGNEYNTQTLTPPEQSKISSRDYAGCFNDFLDDRPDDTPFFFWCGGHEPHRAYAPGEGIRHGKRLEDVTEVPPYWPQEDAIRSDMLDYAFEIEWFDQQVAKLLDKLKAIDELDNTLVVYTSDNGAPFPRVKGQMYDDDFRLPLSIMWRDRTRGDRVVDDIVSFTDFSLTFLDVARAGAEAGVEGAERDAFFSASPGKSLLDILDATGTGTVTQDREYAYMGRERHDLGREGDLGYPVRCVRTSDFLYVRNFAPERWPAGNPETNYTNCDSSPTKNRILELKDQGDAHYWRLSFGKRPAEELYDMVADPHCMKNLADKPEYAITKARLWSALEAELIRSGDPRMVGGGDIFESYEYVQDAPHSWARYVEGDWHPQRY